MLLENDLRYLGADVDYVKNKMVPWLEIQQFMFVQESMAWPSIRTRRCSWPCRSPSNRAPR